MNKLKEEQNSEKNNQQSEQKESGQENSQQNDQDSKTSKPADQGDKGDEGEQGAENGGKPKAEGEKGDQEQQQAQKPASDNHKEDQQKQKGQGNAGAGASEFSLSKDAEKKLLDDNDELSKYDTFEEQHIKASEEKYDLSKLGESTGLAKGLKESSYKTKLGDIKLEKPDVIKGTEAQQIPLEYQDLVK